MREPYLSNPIPDDVDSESDNETPVPISVEVENEVDVNIVEPEIVYSGTPSIRTRPRYGGSSRYIPSSKIVLGKNVSSELQPETTTITTNGETKYDGLPSNTTACFNPPWDTDLLVFVANGHNLYFYNATTKFPQPPTGLTNPVPFGAGTTYFSGLPNNENGFADNGKIEAVYSRTWLEPKEVCFQVKTDNDWRRWSFTGWDTAGTDTNTITSADDESVSTNNNPVWNQFYAVREDDKSVLADWSATGSLGSERKTYGTGGVVFTQIETIQSIVNVSGDGMYAYNNGKEYHWTDAQLGNSPKDAFDSGEINNATISDYPQDTSTTTTTTIPVPDTLHRFEWAKKNYPFQLNLERGDDDTWDTYITPKAGSIQYWNGARGITSTGNMTANWIDGELYKLEISEVPKEMIIGNYGGTDGAESDLNWTITGWGQTILRGTLETNNGATKLLVKTGSNGLPEYRPFDASLDVNPQEQFTQASTEVKGWWFVGGVKDLQEGLNIYPILVEDDNNLPQHDGEKYFYPPLVIPPEPYLAHIQIDGGNDYIELSNLQNGTLNILDWTKDWSVGITLSGITDNVSDNNYMCLYQRGNNAIYLIRGGTNWGIYVSGDMGGYRHGSNTWYRPEPNGKILFCYKASSQQLKYYLGTDDNTTYNLRATTTLNATSAGGNGVVDSNPLFVGKKTGASTDYHWEGGLNNLVISNICWEGSNINSFFEVGNNKQHYLEKVIYSDITTYCSLGEDEYPNVIDMKNNSTGELVNGTETDYVIDQQTE